MRPSAEILRELFLRSEGRVLRIFAFERAPSVRERAHWTEEELRWIANARERAERTREPFWDALLQIAGERGPLSAALKCAVDWSGQRIEERELDRDQVDKGALLELPSTSAWSLRSDVVTSTGTGHLPLVDLRLRSTEGAVEAARAIGRALVPEGLVLATDASFHVIGSRLVEWPDLVTIWARALRWSPLVDTRFVAHHLERGHGSLRFTAGGGYEQAPGVVASW